MTTKLHITVTGASVTEALRYAYARGGVSVSAMREIFEGDNETLCDLGVGRAEIRGDSVSGFELWTVDRHYLVPTLIEGREPIPHDEWIEVTGKNERYVERVTMGVLRNMSDAYYLDEVTVPAERIT